MDASSRKTPPVIRYLLWAVVITGLVAVGIWLAVNPKEAFAPVDIIYTADLTPEQKNEIITQYQLTPGSNLFETKFQVSDQIKSYAYYVELYQYGTLVGTFIESYSNLRAKEGSIVTGFSMNRGESHRWESLHWTVSFPGGGYATNDAIPFPQGFTAQGFATSTLTNEGNSEEMPRITPEQPIILANIGMNTQEKSEIQSYSCTYLMENPEAIAQYECVYLVKCVFSQQDVAVLAQTLFP